jgi:hypothetical protein
MDIITRRTGKVRTDYKVYTRTEAEGEGIRFRHWSAVGPWEYGLSDDGYVSLCIRTKDYWDSRGRHRRLFTFPYGRVWSGKRARLLYSARRAIGDRNATGCRHWRLRAVRRKRLRLAVQVFVLDMMDGRRTNWDAIQSLLESDGLDTVRKIQSLFRSEKVGYMISQAMQGCISGGVTREYVISGMRHTLERAKVEGDITNMRLELEDLAKILSVLPGARRRGNRLHPYELQ